VSTSGEEKSRGKVLAPLSYAPELMAACLASDQSGLVLLVSSNQHKVIVLEQLSRILDDEGWRRCS